MKYHDLPNEEQIISHDLELFDWQTAVENLEASIAERRNISKK